jgi:hypothetical protein
MVHLRLSMVQAIKRKVATNCGHGCERGPIMDYILPIWMPMASFYLQFHLALYIANMNLAGKVQGCDNL